MVVTEIAVGVRLRGLGLRFSGPFVKVVGAAGMVVGTVVVPIRRITFKT